MKLSESKISESLLKSPDIGDIKDFEREYKLNNNSPKISTIILNWNGLEDTIECIESLERLTYPNYEIIVVDNGSTDGSQEAIVKRFPEVALLQNPENLGFAAGHGKGIRYASGEYIAFLNNDTIVDPRWLDELIKPFLTTNQRIGATNSTTISYRNRDEVQYGGNGTINIFGQVRASDRVEYGIRETHTISGESFMMKKEVIDDLEEFLCHEYFAYYEDIDLSWRLINKGYKLIYSPKSIVYHKGGMTSRKISDRKRVYDVRNKYLTFYRNLSNARLLLVFPLLLFFDIAAMLVLVLYARRTNNARLRFKGIMEFFKSRKHVKRYADGRISLLEKRVYWDKLYISSP
jgi:GT2 family glycosyltransferase